MNHKAIRNKSENSLRFVVRFADKIISTKIFSVRWLRFRLEFETQKWKQKKNWVFHFSDARAFFIFHLKLGREKVFLRDFSICLCCCWRWIGKMPTRRSCRIKVTMIWWWLSFLLETTFIHNSWIVSWLIHPLIHKKSFFYQLSSEQFFLDFLKWRQKFPRENK